MCGDKDEEDTSMADEEVDEIYGSEDLPYNFRFSHSPAYESVSTWKTHSGPQTRPLFVRDAHVRGPRPEFSLSEGGEREEDGEPEEKEDKREEKKIRGRKRREKKKWLMKRRVILKVKSRPF